MLDLWVLYGIIALAFVFDFVNGFHDAANSIATVVSTRVLHPVQAVVWAAVFNFVALWVFGLHVAATVGKGVVEPGTVTPYVIFAGLLGATAWNLITWYGGIPSSSSHALVGGFAGAAVTQAGFGVLIYSGIVKILIFIVVAPVLGMATGFLLMALTYWVFRRWHPGPLGRLFKRLQLVSAAAYSLGHGANDAQKTMGIILAVLIAAEQLGKDDPIPNWVVVGCYAAMGLGTLMGGWRIVKTMGQKICHLRPVHGFSAETGGALCLYLAAWFGIPVSTTHTITGAILGVGATRGIHAVRWAVAGRVIWAWILTIPLSAGMAAGALKVFDLLGWA
ncbi:MAG: inorganic phosphate transporter [Planctomycetes bacterium]|nr:inorganic phosphate transporter [Planctomycetota bacterium]